MLYRVRVLIFLIIAVWLVGTRVQGQTPATPSQTVRFSFTAIDKNKQAVTNLSKEKIRLLEDDVPQVITGFERDPEQPLSLVIMLDTSVSQERALPNAKLAARGFIDAVMRQGKDEVAIISFTDEAMLESDLTNDVSKVKQALDSVKFVIPIPLIKTNPDAAGGTALWDTIWLAAGREVLGRSSSRSRRGIIILTDGVDTASHVKMKDAVERAIKSDTAIFIIGIADEKYGEVDKEPLRDVAEKTGGKFFLPKKITDLPEVFAEIKQELVAPYVVTYTPTVTKKKKDSLRRVRIEITDSELRKQDLHLFHRRGYFVE